VFLQAPDFEVLKAMNQSAVEAEVVTKTLTVRNTPWRSWKHDFKDSSLSHHVLSSFSGDMEMTRECFEMCK